MNAKKIAIASSSPPSSGSGIRSYVDTIAAQLNAIGYDIHYLSPTHQDQNNEPNSAYTYVRTEKHDDPKKITAHLIDYINSHGFLGVINNDNPYIQAAAPALRCPVIAVGHLGTSVIASLVCYQHQWIDHVVAISNDMQRTFVKKYQVPTYKVPIVYNGVPDLGVPQICNDSNRSLKIIYGGGENKRKGAHLLLQSIVSFANMWDGMELHWFGGASDAMKRQLESFTFVKVRAKLPREEFLEELSGSDVLLLPSYDEGCPMIMLESMSLGVVPVASNGIGAMDRMITHGLEGYICDLNNWGTQMLQCLHALRDNRTQLREMKLRTRQRYELDFQIDRTVKSLINLLQQPTVNRENRPNSIQLLKWHRPVDIKTGRASVLDRIRFKFGYLPKAGLLNL